MHKGVNEASGVTTPNLTWQPSGASLQARGMKAGSPRVLERGASKALPGLLKKLLQEAHASVMRLIA